VGQWDWQTGIDMGTTGDGVGLTITISIPDMTAFALTVRLRVVGWNGSSWVDLSGWHTASGNTENSTITGTMIAGISAIGIGSTYWVLPLKLLSFKASEKDCAAILNWSTAEEQNTSYFEIEQSSNGNLFSKAGVVNAKGGSNNNTYAFTTSQTTGESYYRLKMIDKDGSYSYSPVEYVKINCTASTNFINVYPNPSKEGFVYINFNTGITGAAKIALLNSVGQQIITKDITVVAGNNLIKFEMNKIPKGLYFIKLISADNKIIFQPQKVIVE
ncbi:MAG: T9SS type A sorting domain-containing protein, partial [Ferruginibacter sp.]